MHLASKHAMLTLLGVLLSLPLIYFIRPNTGGGTTLLVVIVLLATNAIGGLLWKVPPK
jgi:hypothetical protein